MNLNTSVELWGVIASICCFLLICRTNDCDFSQSKCLIDISKNKPCFNSVSLALSTRVSVPSSSSSSSCLDRCNLSRRSPPRSCSASVQRSQGRCPTACHPHLSWVNTLKNNNTANSDDVTDRINRLLRSMAALFM